MASKHGAEMRAFLSGRGIGALPRASIAPVAPVAYPYSQPATVSGREAVVGASRVRIANVGVGMTESYFWVRLLEGEWPADSMALFHACDGGTVYGGKTEFVKDDAGLARVTVWID